MWTRTGTEVFAIIKDKHSDMITSNTFVTIRMKRWLKSYDVIS